jgi:hypothetical protein
MILKKVPSRELIPLTRYRYLIPVTRVSDPDVYPGPGFFITDPEPWISDPGSNNNKNEE